MTAIHGFHMGNSVALLADGAVYGRDGVLETSACKIVVADTQRFAIAMSSGDWTRDFPILQRQASLPTLESLLLYLELELANFREPFADRQRSVFSLNPCHLLIGGINQASDFEMHVAVFGPYELPAGVKPWSLTKIKIPDWGTGTNPPLEQLQQCLAGVTALTPEVLLEKGADMFELQRKLPIQSPGWEKPFFGIGCHVDMVVIRANGAQKHRLREWPDVMAQQIVPSLSAKQ